MHLQKQKGFRLLKERLKKERTDIIIIIFTNINTLSM